MAVEDLVQWLRAQLDEDERTARACPGDGEWEARDIAVYGADLSPEVRAHMAAHDPARVLREIDAKRQLLDRYEELRAASKEEGLIGDVTEEYQDFLLRMLAVPYSDRPGFREEWAP